MTFLLDLLDVGVAPRESSKRTGIQRDRIAAATVRAVEKIAT
jgi:hypothetical protein